MLLILCVLGEFKKWKDKKKIILVKNVTAFNPKTQKATFPEQVSIEYYNKCHKKSTGTQKKL